MFWSVKVFFLNSNFIHFCTSYYTILYLQFQIKIHIYCWHCRKNNKIYFLRISSIVPAADGFSNATKNRNASLLKPNILSFYSDVRFQKNLTAVRNNALVTAGFLRDPIKLEIDGSE